MIQLKIDPEFRDKIPAMPEEDFNGLRQDILRDGYVRDPLVVWKEGNILLDGHHRWKVITENEETLGDKFTVDYKSFPDRWACIAWICANQLHKHNMTEIQRMKLMHEEYEARQHSEKFKGNQYTKKSGDGEIPQQHFTDLTTGEEKPLPPAKNPGKEPTTRNIIAAEHNVTPDVVRAAVEVGRGIDKAEEVSPGFKKAVLSGKVKARKSDLAALRNMEPEQRKDVAEAILEGPEKAKETIQKYKEPVKMHEMDATPLNPEPYNEDDFRDQVMTFPKEIDDTIRLFLMTHADMLAENEYCKHAFSDMLNGIVRVAEKYRKEYLS